MHSQKRIEEIIRQLIVKGESEVVEFKEAKASFRFKDLGQYFSALSNEALLKDKNEAWLLLGIKDNGEIVSTGWYKDGGFNGLKKQVAENTNARLTFTEIYEVHMDGKRVLAFQIPHALPGVPTTWYGAAYERIGDAAVPLTVDKLDRIRFQGAPDWSRLEVKDACIDDLDPEAVRKAREVFIRSIPSDKSEVIQIANSLSDVDVLNKMGITVKGKITNTALLLLGKPESIAFFDNFIPRITWSLYNDEGFVTAYEHFDIPFIFAIDKAYSRIRNVKYRYYTEQRSILDDEVDRYDPALLKEAINNCIAHQDYTLKGKINIKESENGEYVIFENGGSFIPGDIENVLAPGYKPPYYRNTFLCNAMTKLGMIDTNSMGIPRMYLIQRDRCFPLPTYDLSEYNKVKLTIPGTVLDSKYTRLLKMRPNLNMREVYLLDRVQKSLGIAAHDFRVLKKAGLLEGTPKHPSISFSVAKDVDEVVPYVQRIGMEIEACQQLVVSMLKKVGSASAGDISAMLDHCLSSKLSPQQRRRKVSNMLQKWKEAGVIVVVGSRKAAKWQLPES